MNKPVISLLLLVGLVSATSAQESLAERARKAKGSAAAQVTSGHFKNGDYINERLGFIFTRVAGWDVLNRGQINMNQAMGREALGLKSGVDSEGTEFMAHDGQGQNVILTIRKIPADADVAKFKPEFQAGLSKALPDPKFSDEPVSFGDSQHRFETFRVTYSAQGREIFQSCQTVFIDGYWVQWLVSSSSNEVLTETLKELRSHLSWQAAL
jgi:hypothetical protein